MSHTYTIDDFINEHQLRKNREIQLQMRAKSNAMTRGITRSRDPEERRILAEIVAENVRRMEEQGVLTVEGRVWRFNFQAGH